MQEAEKQEAKIKKQTTKGRLFFYIFHSCSCFFISLFSTSCFLPLCFSLRTRQNARGETSPLSPIIYHRKRCPACLLKRKGGRTLRQVSARERTSPLFLIDHRKRGPAYNLK